MYDLSASLLMSASRRLQASAFDVPTVPVIVEVGQTGYMFSFTITNQSTTPIMPRLNAAVLFATACAVRGSGYSGLPADQKRLRQAPVRQVRLDYARVSTLWLTQIKRI
jgi:hypothetical protein